MLQKNTFGQKKIQISCIDSKVPFWRNWKIAKMALLNQCMKFEKKNDQIFWSIMKMAIRKNIYNVSQGPPNPGFMQETVQQ